MTKRFVVLVAGSTLVVGLAVGGLADRTAGRATASPVRVVDGSTYFEKELNSGVTWRLLSNGLLEYRMPRPLLREGEDPDKWFDKGEFRVRLCLAAESRLHGERLAETNASSGVASKALPNALAVFRGTPGSYRTRCYIVY